MGRSKKNKNPICHAYIWIETTPEIPSPDSLAVPCFRWYQEEVTHVMKQRQSSREESTRRGDREDTHTSWYTFNSSDRMVDSFPNSLASILQYCYWTSLSIAPTNPHSNGINETNRRRDNFAEWIAHQRYLINAPPVTLEIGKSSSTVYNFIVRLLFLDWTWPYFPPPAKPYKITQDPQHPELLSASLLG